MLELAPGYLAYGEERSGVLLLSKRHYTFLVDDILSTRYLELVRKYRKLHIPLRMWDGVIQTIELFDSIAKSSEAIHDGETIDSILPKLKIENLTFNPKILGLNLGRTRWGCNPHTMFSVQGVKPGVHPTQNILDEEAIDLLLTSRYTPSKEHNLLWCVNKFFFFSNKVGNNYFIPNANTYLRSSPNTLMLSFLDMSELDCAEPLSLKERYLVEEGTVTFTYPSLGYDGVLLFIAGKLILDIRDGRDIFVSTDKLKIPFTKLNLSVTHMGDWVSQFGMEDLSIEKILDHDTSFMVPYKNDMFANYAGLNSETSNPYLLISRAHQYEGDFVIDGDGEIVPFLTEQLPNTDVSNEYVVESFFEKNINQLTTTDYESDNGKWEDIVNAINRLGMGVYYTPKTPSYRFVNLSSFKSIQYEE